MQMQSGAHSYTYDIDPSFTHIGELINHSSLNGVFKDSLNNGNYLEVLASSHFDHDYIQKLVSKYLDGNEMLGSDRRTCSILPCKVP